MDHGRRVARRRAVGCVAVVATAALQIAGVASVSPAPIRPPPTGYWLTAADGGVFAFGGVDFHGAATGSASTVVGIAATKSGSGYWVLTDQGRVSEFGDASHYGEMSDPAAEPAVALVPTPTGRGYWIATLDGGVYTFGDAAFYGSTGAIRLAEPVVGMAATPTGRGYWLVALDGGIFSFGDAAFHGSTGAIRLAEPVVGMAATPTGRGYWLVALDGGIFSFGDAAFHGSTGAIRLAQPVVGMAATPTGRGYWLVALDGGIFSFGDAAFHGSTGAIRLAQPVVGMARPGSGTSGGGWHVLGGSGITWPGPRQVALTFDDGPHPTYTPQVLDVLARYGVRATFFEVGRSASMWPYLSRAAYDAGHSVQNHSWAHPHLPSLSAQAMRSELESANDAIQSATGMRPSCLRPPGGGTNANVVAIARSLGLEQILWNVNPSDYLRPGPAAIAARSLQYADGRPLVIGLHDGGGPREQTLAALPSTITGLRARGYEFVRLCR